MKKSENAENLVETDLGSRNGNKWAKPDQD